MATAPSSVSPPTAAATQAANARTSAEVNGVRFGIITAAFLVAYTVVAAFAGFLGKLEAGTLDVAILMTGVVLAIRRLKVLKGNRLSYLQGFGTGIITALVASVLLAGSFWLLGGISDKVVRAIEARDLFGADMGVLIGGLGIILLGTMTGVVTSLIAMQYYRTSDEEESAAG